MSMFNRREMLTVLALAVTTGAVMSAPVAAAAASPPDRAAPTVPTNLRVQNLSYTWLTLAWEPSTDNFGTVMYDVEILTPGAPIKERAFDTSQGFGGLAAGTTYTATVRAVDLAGNSSAPVSLQFTTRARTTPPPTTPKNLRGVYVDGTLQSIAWDPSEHDTHVSYVLYSGRNLSSPVRQLLDVG